MILSSSIPSHQWPITAREWLKGIVGIDENQPIARAWPEREVESDEVDDQVPTPRVCGDIDESPRSDEEADVPMSSYSRCDDE